MNKSLEEQMKRKVISDRIDTPDFEAMWSRIQLQLTANAEKKPDKRNLYGATMRKKKFITAAVACSFLIAVPVMASMNLNWEQLWRGESTMNALTVGLGERLNLTATSNHASLTLKGVVTDDQLMNVPFQLEMKNVPAYDFIDFGQVKLTDESGVAYHVDTQLERAAENDQMIGILRTENQLKDRSLDYKLHVQDLVFYNYNFIKVTANPADIEKKSFSLSDPEYSRLAVTSLIREGSALTIRYELDATDSSLTNGPHLVFANDGTTLKSKYSAVLSSSEDGRAVLQETFEISDEQLSKSTLGLSYLAEAERRIGTWDFAFEADGKKASQAIYRKDLDPSVVTNDSVMAFKELVITPLEIRLTYDDKSSGNFNFPTIRYDKAVLHINGQDIEGGGWLEDDGSGGYLSFESPEWYKDWSNVPMSLTLSEPRIQDKAPADQLLQLTSPNSAAQQVSTELQGFPVTFTYYMEGQDLIVESSSPDTNFRGITQSYLVSGEEHILSEMNPKPPGGNGTNKTIERYQDVPEGDLLLSPFLYVWTDPLRKAEIRISE
ncbi:DUF4179 domain-containing protein [Paenibacillus sp. NEAU-GSW1]|uniref:DUF4179 domain-containing protein n=1 Tax=Paenibacillus sp. NEAU-GSW1 TaxID=2682486 RepID=UPI0012E14444|nr:DUF4179 domain-containing protein [Paenibacillus sp. NEAU-GSW1]MUT64727.1 DUF4179 domain-containing protein [Paenibacillus sp. NEAU-GSW1]